ncbi:hypothetical protein ACB092_01G078000 [Castanea dentata]
MRKMSSSSLSPLTCPRASTKGLGSSSSRNIQHKNVIQFLGACTISPSLCIVMGSMIGCEGINFILIRTQKSKFYLWFSRIL